MARPIPELTAKEADRFARKCAINENGCFEWTGFRMHKGYGIFWLRNITQRAHRVAYRLHFGIDPQDALVCHTCDNPACVNPEHLWLGDPKSNMQDMIRKGRKNGRPKKTKEDYCCPKCGHDRRNPVFWGSAA